MRLFRFVPIITVTLVLLMSASVLLSRGSVADVCLTVSENSGVPHRFYVDTAYGRSHQLPVLTTSSFGAGSADGRFVASFAVHRDQTMDLILSEYPGGDEPTRTTVIRSGLRAETAVDSNNHLLWSPDNHTFAYLWRDHDDHLYLSVYNVPTATEQTIPYRLRSGTSFFNGVQITGWSGDGRWFAVQERTGGALYYRFYAASPLALTPTGLDDLPLYFGSWSPTEALIAAVDLGTADAATLYLQPMNAPPQVIPLAVSRRGVQGIHWSPDGRYFVLINYMRDCVGAACDLYWRFDLYARDGTLIERNLSGLHAIPSDQGERLLMGVWQGDHHWLWAEQATVDAPINLVALDLRTRERAIIAANLLPTYVPDMFLARWQNWVYVLPNSTNPPRIPDNDWLIVPWREGEHVHVDLLNVATGERTPIVSGADALVGTSGFWSWNGQLALVVWSRGQSPNRQTYLSVVDLADQSVHSTGAGANHIFSVNWFNDTQIGFIRQTGSTFALDMLDIQTGAQQHLLDLVTSVYQWTGSVNPTGAQIAVNLPGSSPRGSSYLIALDGSTPAELSANATSSLQWSPDGARLAFLEYTRTKLHVVIATSDGTRLGTIPLDTTPYNASIWLGGWTRCDPPTL